jgi:hypothetical protein
VLFVDAIHHTPYSLTQHTFVYASSQVITPRRTFVFYCETPEETEDWRDAINAIQSFLVPEEYASGSEVNHEVFENHRYQTHVMLVLC